MAQNSFTLDVSKLGDDAKVYTINDNSIGPKQQAFRPCIVIDGAVYMASGNEDRFNVSSDGTMEYVKVNKLGTSNVSMQHILLKLSLQEKIPQLKPLKMEIQVLNQIVH